MIKGQLGYSEQRRVPRHKVTDRRHAVLDPSRVDIAKKGDIHRAQTTNRHLILPAGMRK
jgi:hypothetical protein